MRYRILGPLEVVRGDETVDLGGHRQRALLAILLLSAGRVVAVETLIDRLWGESPPPTAAGTLHSYISNLRRLLEPDRPPRAPSEVLASVRPGYLLKVAPDQLDATRFENLAAAGRAALAAGDAAAAADHLREALALWRGPALADFADEPFAITEIARLEDARLQAIEDRIEADLILGRHADITAEIQDLVAAHPLRERLRGQAMLALYRSGRQADALAVAREGRDLLAEELGIDPSPALQRLEAAILRQDPELEHRPPSSPLDGGLAQASAAAPSPTRHLVGRTSELAVLERGLRSAAEGAGRIILIGGEPGIGKTTLAEAFASAVPDARVVWGRCQEDQGAPPFWAWRQALREIAADVDDEVLATTVGGDTAVVSAVIPELAARLPAGPASPPDADTARFQFFDAASRLLQLVSTERPVVVVLDDIHWADVATLGLLRYLTGSLRACRLLVVATYRDVSTGDDSRVAEILAHLAREPMAERIVLRGLDPDEVGDVLAAVLGGPPDQTLARVVHDRTDGNPLFVAHLARLVTDTRVEGTGEVSRVVQERVPPEITDLIGWRVAGLAEGTRRALEIAAVVGREVDLSLLAHALDLPIDHVLTLLDPATDEGLINSDPDRPGRFRFTHALIREAIQEQLGPTKVARLHGLVGDVLDDLGSPDDVAAVAFHFRCAADVGWTARAATAAVPAADQAMASHGYEDAEEHLARALDLLNTLPPGPDRDRLELQAQSRMARLLMRTRGYAAPGVGAACARARELAAAVDAPADRLVATWGMVTHHMVRGEHETALGFARELLAAADATNDPVVTVAAGQTMGVPSYYLGRLDDARRYLERSLAACRQLPSEVLAGFPQDVTLGNLTFLMLVKWFLGDDQGAEAAIVEGREHGARVRGYDQLFFLTFAGELSVFRRDVPATLDRTAEVLARCGEHGFLQLAAQARIGRGWALVHHAMAGGDAASARRDTEDGLAMIDQGLAYFDQVGSAVRRSHNLTLQAEALHAAGRATEALAAIDAALADCERIGERFFEPETLRVRARILRSPAIGREDEAHDVLTRAVAVAAELGHIPLGRRAAADLAADPSGAQVDR